MSSAADSTEAEPLRIAILGLGEAGTRFTRDLLAAGATVTAWDPVTQQAVPGIDFAGSNAEAARQADVILSLNLASVAADVAREVAPVLGENQVFAEMNTTSPQVKWEVARLVEARGAACADVAIMAPVEPRGLETPFLVSGSGSHEFRERMSRYAPNIELVDGEAGSAATLKLLRSIAYKGIAAVVMECLEASRVLGLESYAREQLATLLDHDAIDRFEQGTRKHARRRIHEMEAVEELLESLEVAPHTSRAALQRLRALAEPTTWRE